jgi:hypothetical protein
LRSVRFNTKNIVCFQGIHFGEALFCEAQKGRSTFTMVDIMVIMSLTKQGKTLTETQVKLMLIIGPFSTGSRFGRPSDAS